MQTKKWYFAVNLGKMVRFCEKLGMNTEKEGPAGIEPTASCIAGACCAPAV